MSKMDEKKKSKKEFWATYYQNTRTLSYIRLIIGTMLSIGFLIATIVIATGSYKRDLALVIIFAILFFVFLIIGISNLYVLIKHRPKD